VRLATQREGSPGNDLFDLLLVDSERYLDLFQSKTQSQYGTDS